MVVLPSGFTKVISQSLVIIKLYSLLPVLIFPMPLYGRPRWSKEITPKLAVYNEESATAHVTATLVIPYFTILHQETQK